MSEKTTIRLSAEEAREARNEGLDRTDWARFEALTDDDIERAVAEDPDAGPLRDEGFWRDAQLVIPAKNIPFWIRVDDDVIDFFRNEGDDYKSRINDILRDHVERQRLRKAGED